ncbi:MAG TPA: NAD-dependent epimerase/dehydratase family protein [Actinomycetota bacterium]|jgi:nucleoside-diphosphate-sugar epimerase|nr:NAD-dependent epimerase/dehydratase family protein [Actinomycetota bacterium]
MRIVVVGATGNIATSLLPMLSADPSVDSIVGVARRPPDDLTLAKLSWHAADIVHDDLDPVLAGADACVHLAWEVQPSHDEFALARTNVHGTARLLEAVNRANVPAFVYASSIGTYARGPKNRAVDESWPATGIPDSSYARQKAAVETMLDVVESARSDIRIVRMRPSLICKRGQAAEATRFFLGRLIPRALFRPDRVRMVPDVAGLRTQVIHTDDVADAFHRAIRQPVRGALNVAAEPVIDARTIADVLDARAVPVPAAVARAAVELSWRLHLQPTDPGWLAMGLATPIMSTQRARDELGWAPRMTSIEAVTQLLEGIATDSGEETPRLEPSRREGI